MSPVLMREGMLRTWLGWKDRDTGPQRGRDLGGKWVTAHKYWSLVQGHWYRVTRMVSVLIIP